MVYNLRISISYLHFVWMSVRMWTFGLSSHLDYHHNPMVIQFAGNSGFLWTMDRILFPNPVGNRYNHTLFIVNVTHKEKESWSIHLI